MTSSSPRVRRLPSPLPFHRRPAEAHPHGPIANHDDLQHAPDENLRIWNLWYGIDFYAQLFTMPGGVKRAGSGPNREEQRLLPVGPSYDVPPEA